MLSDWVERTEVVSEPGAVIRVQRIILTPKGKAALTINRRVWEKATAMPGRSWWRQIMEVFR